MTVIFLLLLFPARAAFGVRSRVELVALGLALWIAVDVIQKARQFH